MKQHAQVAVIGGGLVGCSILYHLAKLGWRDVILLERDELTSGSTWHAAAGTHGLHDNNNISRMQYYTMKLYAELERETGQSCGIHQPGAVYLACNKERVHQLRIQASKAAAFDAEFYEIPPGDIRDLHPLLETGDVLCAMYEPLAGHVDPSGVTHAYAHGARALGAEIVRFATVLETNALPGSKGGGWEVVTSKGKVRAEFVVNAAGLWAREVAAMAGLTLPLAAMEHQYFVTESIPAIAALQRELPAVADRDKEYYMRQEGDGLLVGAYEADGRFWSEDGTPMDFGHELLQPDLERIEDNVMRACERVPVLAEAGIKRVINGPMIWSPDSAALLGPAPGLRNYFVCCGIIPGFSQSAGLGLTVAQWLVEGEPELDMFAWDVTRFGAWATPAFTRARALDTYSSRFRIHFPFDERDAGRPVHTRPVYAMQRDLGAVFGLSYGWEHPQWFARDGVAQRDDFGFERPAWFDSVGAECRALRASVGVIDTSNFAKYEITGPGAHAWLERLIANHVPARDGRTCLTPLLSQRGGLAGDFTVARIEAGRLLMIGSGIAEDYHRRIFERHLPAKGVAFRSVTKALAGFNIAGPNARELLQRLAGRPFSNDELPFMRNRLAMLDGVADIDAPAVLLRVSFTGDLGYEIYVEEKFQLALYQAIFAHGADLGVDGDGSGVTPVGSRALGSLRIEKGYGSWGREYSPEWWPHESGLAGLVKTDKPAFLGRDAWLEIKRRPPRQLLRCFIVDTEDANADAWGGETIYRGGEYAGRVTSGAFGFSVGRSVALGYVDADGVGDGDGDGAGDGDGDDNAGGDYTIAVLGRPYRATMLSAPPFDPQGLRLRG
ncbi:MAG: FAD-dependent oxidoreductase [Gammaproteobacteria bacterium]|nr:FAD-dependent oxidoreductase [Gammaproteobacteria bacterium]